VAATVPAAASRAATTCAELDAWICKLRVDLAPDNGADYIRDALAGISAHSTPGWGGTVPVDDQPGPGPIRLTGPEPGQTTA
jgi:hypothetical protein